MSHFRDMTRNLMSCWEEWIFCSEGWKSDQRSLSVTLNAVDSLFFTAKLLQQNPQNSPVKKNIVKMVQNICSQIYWR